MNFQEKNADETPSIETFLKWNSAAAASFVYVAAGRHTVRVQNNPVRTLRKWQSPA